MSNSTTGERHYAPHTESKTEGGREEPGAEDGEGTRDGDVRRHLTARKSLCEKAAAGVAVLDAQRDNDAIAEDPDGEVGQEGTCRAGKGDGLGETGRMSTAAGGIWTVEITCRACAEEDAGANRAADGCKTFV